MHVGIDFLSAWTRASPAVASGSGKEQDLPVFAKRAGLKVVAVVKETASGAKNERVQRNEVMLSPKRGRSTPSYGVVALGCGTQDSCAKDGIAIEIGEDKRV